MEGGACGQFNGGLLIRRVAVEGAALHSAAHGDGPEAVIRSMLDIVAAHPAQRIADAHLIPGPGGALLRFTGEDHGDIVRIYAEALGLAGGFLPEMRAAGINDAGRGVFGGGSPQGIVDGGDVIPNGGEGREILHVIQPEGVCAGVVFPGLPVGDGQAAGSIADGEAGGGVDVALHAPQLIVPEDEQVAHRAALYAVIHAEHGDAVGLRLVDADGDILPLAQEAGVVGDLPGQALWLGDGVEAQPVVSVHQHQGGEAVQVGGGSIAGNVVAVVPDGRAGQDAALVRDEGGQGLLQFLR